MAFHQIAFNDYSDWAKADKKLFERIRRLIIKRIANFKANADIHLDGSSN